MSRILVVGINYAPECIGTGKYSAELCEWLVGQGHEVRVVTAPPHHPAWKQWAGYRSDGFNIEQRNGVHVIRCPVYMPSEATGLHRLLHLGSFALGSMVALLYSMDWRPQLVINIAPTLASAPGAWLFSRLVRARCWLHLQDFEVDAAVHAGVFGSGTARKVVHALEHWLLRRFDVVSTISRQMQERLAAKGVDRQQQAFLPNWVDIDTIRPLAEPSLYRGQLGIPKAAVVALYSGNMDFCQGLEMLSEAAVALSGSSVVKGVPEVASGPLHFVFGGQGPARAGLEAACAHLPNVHFVDLQPIERLRDWLGLADIHLLPQPAGDRAPALPSALSGMLASGRPVLAAALPGSGLYHTVLGHGLSTPPGNTRAFAEALTQLAADPDMRRRFGTAARHRAEDTLSIHAVLSDFQHRVKGLLSGA